MPQNLNPRIIVAAAAIIYAGLMFLFDWNTTAVIIGALIVALIAVFAGRLSKTHK